MNHFSTYHWVFIRDRSSFGVGVNLFGIQFATDGQSRLSISYAGTSQTLFRFQIWQRDISYGNSSSGSDVAFDVGCLKQIRNKECVSLANYESMFTWNKVELDSYL